MTNEKSKQDQLALSIVDRYFGEAVRYATVVSGPEDQECDAALKNTDISFPRRQAAVAKWIREYKVHRLPWKKGILSTGHPFAEGAAALTLQHFDSLPQKFRSHEIEFETLRAKLGDFYNRHEASERSMLSLTSKLLWRRFPNDAPIYDEYVFNALGILNKVQKSFQHPGPIREKPKTKNKNPKNHSCKAAADLGSYLSFCDGHTAIYKIFEHEITERIERSNARTDAFRIFDKILWILGSPNIDVDFN